jgi:hypothetical protein
MQNKEHCFPNALSAEMFCIHGSSVGIATAYGLDGRGSIAGRGNIFLFSITCRRPLGPTQPPIQWVPAALSSEVKWQEREADHSLPSSAEVKNDGAIHPLPHTSSWSIASLIKHKDNLPFLCPLLYCLHKNTDWTSNHNLKLRTTVWQKKKIGFLYGTKSKTVEKNPLL